MRNEFLGCCGEQNNSDLGCARQARCHDGQREEIIALRKQGAFAVGIVKAVGLNAGGCEIVMRVLIKAGLK